MVRWARPVVDKSVTVFCPHIFAGSRDIVLSGSRPGRVPVPGDVTEPSSGPTGGAAAERPLREEIHCSTASPNFLESASKMYTKEAALGSWAFSVPDPSGWFAGSPTALPCPAPGSFLGSPSPRALGPAPLCTQASDWSAAKPGLLGTVVRHFK